MLISETDLILNPDGSVYHLNLLPEDISDTIITVGDPDRVPMVSVYFDKILVKKQKREFVTHTGEIGKKKITVLSTGIGTDNVDIVMNELDALVNVDLKTREVKKSLTRLNIVRIGTSGSLSKDIPVDSFVASAHGLGLDTLYAYYNFAQTPEDSAFCEALKAALKLNFMPYAASGAPELLSRMRDLYIGFTASSPGFYAPQGRSVRGAVSNGNFMDDLTAFNFGGRSITNFEMETSAYYALGNLLGHSCLSVNAIVANRALRQYSKNSTKTITSLIENVLERLEFLTGG
jgi:uridine phosphorylase